MGNDMGGGVIAIRVFADLRKFQDPEISYQVDGPVPVSTVLGQLSIPPEKVKILFVNGRHADFGDMVSPGDTLSLFPPVGGG